MSVEEKTPKRRGRPPGKGEGRDAKATVMLTEEIAAEVRARAAADGLSESTWMFRAIKAALARKRR